MYESLGHTPLQFLYEFRRTIRGCLVFRPPIPLSRQDVYANASAVRLCSAESAYSNVLARSVGDSHAPAFPPPVAHISAIAQSLVPSPVLPDAVVLSSLRTPSARTQSHPARPI